MIFGHLCTEPDMCAYCGRPAWSHYYREWSKASDDEPWQVRLWGNVGEYIEAFDACGAKANEQNLSSDS